MTTTSTVAIQPREGGKQKGVLKKVIKYLQDQAIENSNPRSFVKPPGLEPQQKITASPQNSHVLRFITQRRRFSDATTAVERRPGAMAGDGVDAGVLHESIIATTKEMKKVQYAQDNILQNYRIHVPERDTETIQGDQYWIIYIHGGYFRDPKVDALSFRPTLEILSAEQTSSSQTGPLATVPESTTPSPLSSRQSFAPEYGLLRGRVAGYASINYRLAPHPEYPQDDGAENYVRRNARFPDQLNDVHAAIRHLQTRYNFTNNYILAGHSVGATLACLAALRAVQGQIDPPACVVGLNGIYNFPLIHETNPDYETMTKNTMSSDQYRDASPALYPQSEYAKILPKQTLRILLSHSRDDGLVNWQQLESMQAALQSDSHDTQLHVETLETYGQHDEIWKDGRELARSLVAALRMMTDY